MPEGGEVQPLTTTRGALRNIDQGVPPFASQEIPLGLMQPEDWSVGYLMPNKIPEGAGEAYVQRKALAFVSRAAVAIEIADSIYDQPLPGYSPETPVTREWLDTTLLPVVGEVNARIQAQAQAMQRPDYVPPEGSLLEKTLAALVPYDARPAEKADEKSRDILVRAAQRVIANKETIPALFPPFLRAIRRYYETRNNGKPPTVAEFQHMALHSMHILRHLTKLTAEETNLFHRALGIDIEAHSQVAIVHQIESALPIDRYDPKNFVGTKTGGIMLAPEVAKNIEDAVVSALTDTAEDHGITTQEYTRTCPASARLPGNSEENHELITTAMSYVVGSNLS